jgi:hypothetical protein
MGFADLLSFLLRLFFALPSLQSRDGNIGFRETGIQQTYAFSACRAGYRREAGANFMQSWCKPEASMERGWYGLGTRKVRIKDDTKFIKEIFP